MVIIHAKVMEISSRMVKTEQQGQIKHCDSIIDKPHQLTRGSAKRKEVKRATERMNELSNGYRFRFEF